MSTSWDPNRPKSTASNPGTGAEAHKNQRRTTRHPQAGRDIPAWSWLQWVRSPSCPDKPRTGYLSRCRPVLQRQGPPWAHPHRGPYPDRRSSPGRNQTFYMPRPDRAGSGSSCRSRHRSHCTTPTRIATSNCKEHRRRSHRRSSTLERSRRGVPSKVRSGAHPNRRTPQRPCVSSPAKSNSRGTAPRSACTATDPRTSRSAS